MGKIYSTTQLHTLEQKALASGLSASDLVEQTAQAYARALPSLYRPSVRLNIFCGPSSCGASGLALARFLHERKRYVRVYLFYGSSDLTELCAEQYERLPSDLPIELITKEFTPPKFEAGEIIVDALFGYDLTQPLSKGFAHLVTYLNGLGQDILSLDQPSGLFADDNAFNSSEAIIRARHTLCPETPRLSCLLKECAPYVGQWHLAPLGLPSEVHQQVGADFFTVDELQIAQVLLKRKPFESVKHYGHALILGGGTALAGRSLIACRASLLMGVGELSLSTQAQSAELFHQALPELRLLLEGQKPNLKDYQAIALGVAVEQGDLTADALQSYLFGVHCPVVLSGEALLIVLQDQALRALLGGQTVLVINESYRKSILGHHERDLDYIEAARQLSQSLGLTVILRGLYTLICRPTGKDFFALGGNQGLMRAGMDELFMGLLVGLLARGYDSLTACILASYLQGRGADNYVARLSAETLTPSALLGELPGILRDLYE